MKSEIRNFALSSALALAGVVGADVVRNPQAPTAEAATSACVSKTHGIPVEADHSKTFKARKAIVTGDISVNGVRRYDDVAETGAVNVLMSDKCKTWTVDAPFGASITVVADRESQNSFLVREAKAINMMSTARGAADVYVSK